MFGFFSDGQMRRCECRKRRRAAEAALFVIRRGRVYECLMVYLPFCSWETYSFDLEPSSRLNHTSSLLTLVMMALREPDTQTQPLFDCQSQ